LRPDEINIIKYGPLRGVDLQLQPGLNIIYGRNESGKTLAIDASLKMLLRNPRDFEGIDRVDERPEGYVTMETGGKEIKLSTQEGTLSDYLELDGSDLRNVFIIRNSDLFMSGEGDYLRSFTNRMVGIQTDRIESITGIIQGKGWLTQPTSSADLSSSRNNSYIGKRFKNAQKLLGELESYNTNIVETGVDKAELELSELTQDLYEAQSQKDSLEKSRIKTRYDGASAALEELEVVQKSVDTLSHFDEDELQNLKNLELEQGTLISNIEEQVKVHKERKDEVDRLSEKLRQIRVNLQPFDERAKDRSDLKAEVNLHQNRVKPDTPINIQLYSRLFLLFFVSSVVSFTALVITGSTLSLTLGFPVMLIILSIVAGLLFWRTNGINNGIESEKQTLFSKGAALGINANDVNEIILALSNLEEQHSKLKKSLEEEKTSHDKLDGSLSEIYSALENKKKRVTEIQVSLNNALRESGMRSIEEYEGNLNEKNKKLDRIKELNGLLQGYLGQADEVDEIPFWKGELSKIAYAKDYQILDHYSEELVKETEERIQNIDQQKTDLDEKLSQHQEKLNDLNRMLQEIRPLNNSGEEVVTEIVISHDIMDAINILKSFIGYVNDKLNSARIAIQLFEKVKAQEERKVSTIFEDGRVKELFSRITSARYKDILYNSDSGTIEVVKSDGKTLPASSLSKGTIDQLYMAIRVSLAEKLLPDEKAFFILDDPFLASDSTRLKEQMEMLQGLCEEGWSITYFTAKDEVVNLARDVLKKEVMMLPSIS